jgi:hypothetical protein
LISEELAPLAIKLVAAVGKQPITGIVLDVSYYPSNLRIPGIEETNESSPARNSAHCMLEKVNPQVVAPRLTFHAGARGSLRRRWPLRRRR